MVARHLLWHVGIAAVAVAVFTTLGMPFASALPIGLVAGCMAMLFRGGSHEPQHTTRRRTGEQEVRWR